MSILNTNFIQSKVNKYLYIISLSLLVLYNGMLKKEVNIYHPYLPGIYMLKQSYTCS